MSEASGEEYGSLIVYLNEKWQGKDVIVRKAYKERHANVVSRTIDGQITFAAIFPRLAEGTYEVFVDVVYSSNPNYTRVDVFPGHEAEVDFRSRNP